MSHVDKRVSALVDGELGHEARDRALAHVAICSGCRELLSVERSVKERLAKSASPDAPGALIAGLLSIGDPPPPSDSRRSVAPVVPQLPPIARRGVQWPRRPPQRNDNRRPRPSTLRRRARYAATGVLSAGVLVLATAFAAGGGGSSTGAPLVPPAGDLSVEHVATTSGLPLPDPAFDAVTASFGGLTFAPVPGTVAGR